MINNFLKSSYLAFAIVGSLGAVQAQEVEIYIPGQSDAVPELNETDNLLARCLATGLEEYCSGVSLNQNGETLESNGPPDIILETFVIDLNDEQDTPQPKVSVRDKDEEQPKDTKTVRSAGVVIEFDYNSHKLRSDQIDKMSHIALALADDINEGAGFAVVGHTDGKGSDLYNCKLSKKRAATITSSLLMNGAKAQLFPIGAGEALLKEPANPNSEKNRRVSFLKLGENARVTMNAFLSLCQ